MHLPQVMFEYMFSFFVLTTIWIGFAVFFLVFFESRIYVIRAGVDKFLHRIECVDVISTRSGKWITWHI